MRRFDLAVAALMLTAVPAFPASGTEARTGEPASAEDAVDVSFAKFELPNGLTTIVHTDRTAPSIFIGVWYRTGSRDEPPGNTGFAHLFEHLMFQATANRETEFIAALNEIGATGANGVTRADHTTYFQTVPTNAIDAALWLESDRMGYLDGGITQALLDEQRNVVLNEKRQGEARPEDAATRHFLAAFYPEGHPYAHPTIGSTADLEGATLDDVKAWFANHYGANNAVLVLSGDIDAVTAREKVARYFGAIPAGPKSNRPIAWSPDFGSIRRDEFYGPFAQPTIARSWPVPNGDPQERTLLLLGARAMAGSPDSPLVRALVGPENVATGVSARLEESELGSVLQLSMGVRPGVPIDEARAALDTALSTYLADGPPTERLETIVASTNTYLLRSLENLSVLGTFMAEGELVHGDPGYFLRQRDWIVAATPDAVRAAARTWFSRPYYELTTLPVPPQTAAPMDADRTHMPLPGPLKTAIDFPTVTQTTLPGGLKLVVAQRPDAGITDMSLRFARNPLAATDTETATAQRAFALLTASEPENGAEPIRQRLARNGIALRTDVGEWDASVTWSAANPEVGLSLELVGEMLAQARFPQAAVDRANADASRRVAGREVSSDRLLRHALLGESDPRGRLSPADSVDIPREALLAYRDTAMAPENATLYIVGGVDPARARDLAMRNFGTPRNGAATPPHPTPIPAAAPQSARIILVDAPGAQQSSISVGKVIAPFSAENVAVEALVAGVLADHGPGRFNRNLRQSKGWSYAFGGGIEDSPAGQRLFSASGTVQADKTAESLLALQDELSGIVGARPVSQAELDAQRRLLIGRTVQEFTGNAAFLQAFVTAGTYGLPYDRAASVDRRLAAVMIEDAREVASTLFDGPATFVVIGDLASIEPAIRTQAFAPVEIWDSAGRKVR